MAPYKSPAPGSCTIYFQKGVYIVSKVQPFITICRCQCFHFDLLQLSRKTSNLEYIPPKYLPRWFQHWKHLRQLVPILPPDSRRGEPSKMMKRNFCFEISSPQENLSIKQNPLIIYWKRNNNYWKRNNNLTFSKHFNKVTKYLGNLKKPEFVSGIFRWSTNPPFPPHRIHVWYNIYLHLVDFYGKCS